MASKRIFWTLATPFVWLLNRCGLCSYYYVNLCTGARRRDLFDALWHYEKYGTPIGAMPSEQTLCGWGYRVATHEGLVLFRDDYDPRNRITFERDPHDSLSTLWYVTLAGRIAASHADEAYRWVKAVYGGSFDKRPSSSPESKT